MASVRAFLSRFQFEYLRDALLGVFRRFPLPFLCCAAGTLLPILEIHDVKPLSDEMLTRTMLLLVYGFGASAALRLYAEAARLPRTAEFGLCALSAAALAALSFGTAHFGAPHLFAGAGIALAALFAPYVGRAASDDSVWFFNYLNGMSAVIAGLSAFVLCLGLLAIYGSMDYLLYDMKLPREVYGDIWCFGWLFFAPVALLHQVSTQFHFEKSECAIPKGVSFIANYLAVPLVLIYTWVLYVYFLKIAVQWELPKGNLAYMVMGFGSAGSAARLAVFPMRETGTKLLQQFYKYFYPLMIVPLVLLAIGLYTRIHAYGITEDRYAIALGLAWLTILTVWALLRPSEIRLKHVPIVLSALFLLAAAGPWGVSAVSAASQASRLENMLRQAGVITAAGEVVKTKQDVPFELRKTISAELDYFAATRLAYIEPWVAPFRKDILAKHKGIELGCKQFMTCWGGGTAEEIMEAWGMAYVQTWQQNAEVQRFDVNTPAGWNGDTLIRVAPWEYLMHFNAYSGSSVVQLTPAGDSAANKLKATITTTATGVVTLALGDGRSVTFPLQPLAEALRRDKLDIGQPAPQERLTLHAENGSLKAELRLNNLRGTIRGDSFQFESAYGMILFTP
jgi:hypothetical protein